MKQRDFINLLHSETGMAWDVAQDLAVGLDDLCRSLGVDDELGYLEILSMIYRWKKYNLTPIGIEGESDELLR